MSHSLLMACTLSGLRRSWCRLSALRVALVGNPNCGKTALFNLLTGSRQKVANYAGVTVERKEGRSGHARRAASCACSTCPAPTA
jgi:ribosome-binding ATPase YchF (GTP1/OBG family)